MRKLLIFVFWELKCFFAAMSEGNNLSELKAILVMGAVETAALITLLNLLSLRVGHRILPTHSAFTVLLLAGFGLFLVILTRRICITQNHSKKYSREFERYSSVTLTVGGIVILIVVVSSVIALGTSASAVAHLPQ